MKIRWIFNALAAMEAVLCPALCLMYAFCGLALWTQTVYFCPLLGAVLAALLFSRDKRRFIWKCAGSLCLFAALFILALKLGWWGDVVAVFNAQYAAEYGGMNMGDAAGIFLLWTPTAFAALIGGVIVSAGVRRSVIENENLRASAGGLRENRVMGCGGTRCTGAEYAEIIAVFDCAAFEIEEFETVCETPDAVQVHYVITTTAEKPENSDLSGKFHITSTWRNTGGRWKLVFNMDRNVPER